ncbi:MAG: YkgJ family cysteine cluster protein [Deltaproteobacteria bacterium]
MQDDNNRQFPEGMEPLGSRSFSFRCHAGVSCYTRCCANVDMYLYPYDIIRLKRRLGISSGEFLQQYSRMVQGQNPYFPSLMMQMKDNDDKSCPFLVASGCSVYEDRPSSCRMYPLERAVDRNPQRGRPEEFYFLTNHPYCKGHQEQEKWTAREWLRNQGLLYYNLMDDLWAEIDTLFAGNPFEGEGVAGPRQQVAFMVCYNLDGFREYVLHHKLLDGFRLESGRKRDLLAQDEELLKFGYDWLKLILGGVSSLRPKR